MFLDDEDCLSYEDAVRLMIRALNAYLPWLREEVYGVRDPESGEWEVEPCGLPAAKRECDALEEVLKGLEEFAKNVMPKQVTHDVSRRKQ